MAGRLISDSITDCEYPRSFGEPSDLYYASPIGRQVAGTSVGGENGRICVGTAGFAVRGSALAARRRPLCRRHGTAADGVWPCAALAPCPCPDPLDRHERGQGRTRGARGADRGGVGGFGLARLAFGVGA